MHFQYCHQTWINTEQTECNPKRDHKKRINGHNVHCSTRWLCSLGKWRTNLQIEPLSFKYPNRLFFFKYERVCAKCKLKFNLKCLTCTHVSPLNDEFMVKIFILNPSLVPDIIRITSVNKCVLLYLLMSQDFAILMFHDENIHRIVNVWGSVYDPIERKCEFSFSLLNIICTRSILCRCKFYCIVNCKFHL